MHFDMTNIIKVCRPVVGFRIYIIYQLCLLKSFSFYYKEVYIHNYILNYHWSDMARDSSKLMLGIYICVLILYLQCMLLEGNRKFVTFFTFFLIL